MADQTVTSIPKPRGTSFATEQRTRVAGTLPPAEDVPEVLQASVAELKKQWELTQRERDDVSELIWFARGNQIDSTPGMPEETEEHQQRKPRFAANFLGLTLDLLSYLYTDDPVRTSPQDEKWRKILWDYRYGLTALLDDADPWIRLGGTSIAYSHPSWGDGPQSLGKALHGQEDGQPEGFDVYILPRDRFVAAVDRVDPRHLAAVAILQSVEIDTFWSRSMTQEKSVERDVHEYWDDTYWARLDGWSVTDYAEHGLGGLPVTTLPNTLSPLSVYGDPIGGGDLIRNYRTVNSLLEEILHVSRLQRGQMVVSGELRDGGSITLGPDTPLHMAEGTDGAQFLSNAGDIPNMIEGLQTALIALARTMHLPLRTFKLKDSSPISAVSIVTDRIELKEDRRKRSQVAKHRWEPSIHRIVALQAARWGIDLDYRDVNVRFVAQTPPLTHAEMLAQVAFEFDKNIAGRDETKEKLNPWLTPDERALLLAASDEDTKTRMAREIARAGHAEDTIQPTDPAEQVEDDNDE